MIRVAPWQCLTWRGNHASLGRKRYPDARRTLAVSILTTDADALRYSQINLIRCALDDQLRREHADFVVTAFLKAQEALQQPCEGGTRIYAPRFPFSAHRDRALAVYLGLWARRGSAAARGPRGIRQQSVMARGPRNDICAAGRSHERSRRRSRKACPGGAAARCARRRYA